MCPIYEITVWKQAKTSPNGRVNHNLQQGWPTIGSQGKYLRPSVTWVVFVIESNKHQNTLYNYQHNAQYSIIQLYLND